MSDEQRFAFWIEPDDVHRATQYNDGDINLEVTESQAEELIETLERGVEKIGDSQPGDSDE